MVKSSKEVKKQIAKAEKRAAFNWGKTIVRRIKSAPPPRSKAESIISLEITLDWRKIIIIAWGKQIKKWPRSRENSPSLKRKKRIKNTNDIARKISGQIKITRLR